MTSLDDPLRHSGRANIAVHKARREKRDGRRCRSFLFPCRLARHLLCWRHLDRQQIFLRLHPLLPVRAFYSNVPFQERSHTVRQLF